MDKLCEIYEIKNKNKGECFKDLFIFEDYNEKTFFSNLDSIIEINKKIATLKDSYSLIQELPKESKDLLIHNIPLFKEKHICKSETIINEFINSINNTDAKNKISNLDINSFIDNIQYSSELNELIDSIFVTIPKCHNFSIDNAIKSDFKKFIKLQIKRNILDYYLNNSKEKNSLNKNRDLDNEIFFKNLDDLKNEIKEFNELTDKKISKILKKIDILDDYALEHITKIDLLWYISLLSGDDFIKSSIDKKKFINTFKLQSKYKYAKRSRINNIHCSAFKDLIRNTKDILNSYYITRNSNNNADYNTDFNDYIFFKETNTLKFLCALNIVNDSKYRLYSINKIISFNNLSIIEFFFRDLDSFEYYRNISSLDDLFLICHVFTSLINEISTLIIKNLVGKTTLKQKISICENLSKYEGGINIINENILTNLKLVSEDISFKDEAPENQLSMILFYLYKII